MGAAIHRRTAVYTFSVTVYNMYIYFLLMIPIHTVHNIVWKQNKQTENNRNNNNKFDTVTNVPNICSGRCIIIIVLRQ